MTLIIAALRALVGLFFDDGSLALAVIGLLLGTMLLRQAGLINDMGSMSLLVFGSIGAVLENVFRSARAALKRKARATS